MKIYQLHEYSGEWEDFQDCIIGSYFSKQRAEEEKAKAEAEEKELMEHSNRCNGCPFLDEYNGCNLDDLMEEYPDYCPDIELNKTMWGVHCENHYCKWDESTFVIKEVEVLE